MKNKKIRLTNILSLVYLILNIVNIFRIEYHAHTTVKICSVINRVDPNIFERLLVSFCVLYLFIPPFLHVTFFLNRIKNCKPFLIFSGIDILIYFVNMIIYEWFNFSVVFLPSLILFLAQLSLYIVVIRLNFKYVHKTEVLLKPKNITRGKHKGVTIRGLFYD